MITEAARDLSLSMTTDNPTFLVAVAREDITPEVGILLCGYTVREGPSRGVDEPLTVTALLVEGGGGRVAMLAVDWGVASVRFVTDLRERCARAIGGSTQDVLVNFSHSHSTPMSPDWMPYAAPEQLQMLEAWAERVASSAVRACERARAALQPARLATGWGDCRANINRRQKTEDGSVLLGEDAKGPSDHSVGVARFDDMQGRPIAVVYRYSCHTVTLGPRTNLISPDFVGPARALIESQLGCLSLFLQGCAGNQNPVTGIGQDASGREDTVRIGQMVGAEVVKVAVSLRTHRRRREPKLVRSVAVYWLFEHETIPESGLGQVGSEEIILNLPLTPFPAIVEVEKETEEWRRRHVEACERQAPQSERNVTQRFLFWAEQRLAAARGAENPVRVTFPVQCLRIGAWTLVGLPFEPMSETGERLRTLSPGGGAWVLGYSNGLVSYLPTLEVSAEGGMEARLGYKAYLLPAEVPGEWEPRICEAAVTLLKQV